MHEFFPGNYMRSFVTCISLSCGGNVDEIDRIFTHEEGGAEHCHFDNIELGRSYILDWFVEKL